MPTGAAVICTCVVPTGGAAICTCGVPTGGPVTCECGVPWRMLGAPRRWAVSWVLTSCVLRVEGGPAAGADVSDDGMSIFHNAHRQLRYVLIDDHSKASQAHTSQQNLPSTKLHSHQSTNPDTLPTYLLFLRPSLAWAESRCLAFFTLSGVPGCHFAPTLSTGGARSGCEGRGHASSVWIYK